MTRAGGSLKMSLVAAAILAVVAALVASDAMPARAQAFVRTAPTPISNIQTASGRRGAVLFLTGVNGAQVTMPVVRNVAGYTRRYGVQLNVDLQWPGQYGYRPVTFTVRLRKPATADKQIKIRATAGSWYLGKERMTAEQSFTLKSGSTVGTTKVLVPQTENWDHAGWTIYVDGREEAELTVKQMGLASTAIGASSMGVMGVDLSSSEQSAVLAALTQAYSGQNINPRFEKAADLPTDWLHYTTLDLFIMPADQMASLTKSHPAQAAALLRWVRAGGNLWMINAGTRWQRLSEVEQALKVVPTDKAAAAAARADDAIEARGWRFAPLNERAQDPTEGALVLAAFDMVESEKSTVKYKPGEGNNVQPEDTREFFAVRGFGLGAVTAFRRGLQDPFFSNAGRTMAAVTQSLLAPRIAWQTRHGNSPDAVNTEFNNLLIPNVGMAPVGQFQFLITLFVVGIGPLNYWLLKRKHKLPLLLATVPVAAATTTVLLFAYGILADGFSIRARARTLTLLDQRAGEAASWGRLSYYAGIAPRGGMTVARDQAMYPMLPRWSAESYNGGRVYTAPREVVWKDRQQLSRGWLQSRTPTQYQAVTSRPTAKKLELRTTDKGLRVANRLGADLIGLGVQDHGGKFYWCVNLADGEGRVVPASDQQTLATEIRRQFTEHLPEYPGGEDTTNRGNYYGFNSSQGIMEGRLAAINSAVIDAWRNGSYIAFAKQAIELDMGVDEAVEDGSFHVIEGSW